MKIMKYNNLKNISGSKLKELRKKNKMSQQDLAEKLQLEGVTLNKKKNIKLNISYPSENQIKVNNKIFDIEKEDCCIDIIKKYEYNLRYEPEGTYRPGYHTAKYFLNFKGNKISKSFQVTNGTEEQLRDLIYNFEYEISDFKKQKSEFIKSAQNTLEELYDKGSVSQDTLNKLYENKDRNE